MERGKSAPAFQEVGCFADTGKSSPSVEMLGKANVTGQHPSTSCLFMYIHIHELLDHAFLAMHLVLLENLNLSPPSRQLTEKDCSAQVTKDWQGLV